MSGPRPKPTALKVLHGNPGKRPLNKNEPRPRIGKLTCPAWLSAAAKSKWRALVRDLTPLGLLTVVDGDALAAYCIAWSELKTATETLERDGRTTTTSTGYLAPHPAVAMQRSALHAVKAFAALFGLDPADRSKIDAPRPQGLGIVKRDRGAKSRVFALPGSVSEFARQRNQDAEDDDELEKFMAGGSPDRGG